MCNTEEKNNEAIVINRMFAGDYLASNLGHEIINLFQADNKKHYIYLNPKGNFDKTHKDKETGNDKIKYMLFVKTHSSNEFEVIGLATGLKSVEGVDCTLNRKLTDKNEGAYEKQVEYIKNEKVEYGGVEYGGIPIFELFNDAEQQSIFITYEADNVFIPKMGKRIFISYGPDSTAINTDTIKIELTGYNKPSTPLHSYIYPEGTFTGDGTKPNEETKKKRRVDYKNLINNLISKGDDLWQIQNKGVNDNDIKEIKPREVSLFDICQIQNDENRFSNALSYFIQQYPKLWKNLLQYFTNIKDLGEIESVTREEDAKVDKDEYKSKTGGRIDLLIRTKNYYIIVENKIDSQIIVENGVTQLSRYYHYVKYLRDEQIAILEKEETKVKKTQYETENKLNNLRNQKSKYRDNWIKDLENCKEQLDYIESQKDEVSSRGIVGLVLTPNYNQQKPELLIVEDPEPEDPNKGFKFEELTYKDVYDWLESNAKNELNNDINFKYFYDAMKRHTYEYESAALYADMLEKFVRRIKANQDKK